MPITGDPEGSMFDRVEKIELARELLRQARDELVSGMTREAIANLRQALRAVDTITSDLEARADGRD